ncbi:hypothetical protein ThidrDRAFT_4092 [Thiorhodococcus drewsii AZ1]|uniref:Uncharacterized protein n=1 Tax=Thiorhodococcus drewsii AZ1 TaxID=765913 RepID=G2E729_9GAMM|nr:hypothetical protein ThidrDRAFT_4092 [Thiorhodococcus drewsii AZ1]
MSGGLSLGDIQTRISPDFMPVEALWRWLREGVTYHCHASVEELTARA